MPATIQRFGFPSFSLLTRTCTRRSVPKSLKFLYRSTPYRALALQLSPHTLPTYYYDHNHALYFELSGTQLTNTENPHLPVSKELELGRYVHFPKQYTIYKFQICFKSGKKCWVKKIKMQVYYWTNTKTQKELGSCLVFHLGQELGLQ